jgi:uncharacterized membrane protein YcaP (DUF421 family)
MEHGLWYVPWHDLLLPGPSWAEKIVRPILVYLALLLIFRLASKRELAQATLFDFLIILLISNVVQNAMIGSDNSVLGAFAGAIVLVLLSGLLNRLTANNKRRRLLLEGNPSLLIRDGALDEAAMRRQAISRNDLFMAIRKLGLSRLAQVGFAILELDGSISVIPSDSDRRPHDCLPPEAVGAESREDGDR